jgi:hypothetical protein
MYLFQRFETSTGAHPSSYPMAVGISFSGVKVQNSENDHSPPTSAEAKNDEAILSLPHMPPCCGP